MPKAIDGLEYAPQAYTIDKLEIISTFGKVDITYMLEEININENMFAKCITGSVVLNDALNLISNLPVMEGDLIEGLFHRNDSDPNILDYDPEGEIEFTFEIIKITSQTRMKQDLQYWSCSFVSSTWTDHLSGRVSKSYKQMAYSDMVLDIYNTWLTRGGLRGELPVKPLDVEMTEKLWNIIIPNLKPYNAITFLQKRAFQGDFANYLFWEDKEKFNFKTIQSLMAAGEVAQYWTASADVYDGNLEALYNNLIDMRYLEYHDISMAASTGMLGNRLIKHDIYNKRVTDYFPRGTIADNYQLDTPYDYIGDYAKLEHCDPGGVELILPATNLKMAEDDGNTLLSVYPDHMFQWDDQESFKPERWLRQRRGQMASLKFIKFEITTPGNLTRKVGDKIFINIHSAQWKSRESGQLPEPDKKLNGNYLITAIRRKFTRDTYVNVMEVIKDDYVELSNSLYQSSATNDYTPWGL